MSVASRPPGQLEGLLAGLNSGQREAVEATSGPVAIIAGAGTGKTRVISRRAAYAVASGVVRADQVLIVTFTDKAANEMVARLNALGLRGVTARTFHAQALRQLRHFWPLRHDGQPLPAVLESKLPILARLVRGLPGQYRFTPAKDIADEIEWAKSRRLTPASYVDAAPAVGREPPVPLDLFVRVFGDYERAKARAGRLDFDDMLLGAVELLETDEEAAAIVRSRKSWFSVDEYQDTNPLQERLLELWRGDRPDLCVVGDEDQTIYSFTGATSTFLTSFASRHTGARVIALTENYRSTPEILATANRLIASTGRSKELTATRAAGPSPVVADHPSAADETTALADGIRGLVAGGTPPAEIAVLVRTNAQLAPIEAALTRAAIPYRVRGGGFYARADVRQAIDLLATRPSGGHATAEAPPLLDDVRAAWAPLLGSNEPEARGDVARERAAAFETLLAIAQDLASENPAAGRGDLLAELRSRAAAEAAGSDGGVELVTYHRAKGLEWDAVFLPMLEEGSLPIRQALDDDAAVDEERRLLYVGITRARTHLYLSWAEQRESRGRDARRRRSRFLESIAPRLSGRRAIAEGDRRRDRRHGVVELGDAFAGQRPADDRSTAAFEALRAWRSRRSRDDGVPAYVVAHDSTLRAIADAGPMTLAALRRVPGMGPVKLERYGQEILDHIGAVRSDPSLT